LSALRVARSDLAPRSPVLQHGEVHPDSPDANFRAHRVWRTVLNEEVAIHLGGHTHKPMVRWIDDFDARHPDGGVLVLNAGTLAAREGPCVLVLDLVAMEARFHPVTACGEVRPPTIFPLSDLDASAV
jgi:predicted phosphodiesterase